MEKAVPNKTGNPLIKKYICMAIMFAIAFIVSNLQPFGQVTEFGMKAMGCFGAAIFGWLTIGMAWTAFGMILIVPFTGLMTMDTLIVDGFGNSTTIMVIFGMMLFAILTQTDISKKVAAKLLNLKACEGKPWVFFIVLVFTSYVVALLAAGIIAILVMVPIVTSICDKCEYERYSKTSTIMYISVGLGSVLGGLTIPFRGMPIYLLAMFRAMYPDAAIPFLQYFLFTTIFTIVILLVFIAFARLFLRLDLEKIHPIDLAEFGLTETKLTAKEKYIMFVLVFATVLLFAQSFLRTVPFVANFGTFGFFLLGVLMLLIAGFDGKPLTNLQKLSEGIQWQVIMTVVLAMELANAFSGSDAGIVTTISTATSSILQGIPPFVFVILILTIVMLITNFINNGAACIMLFPVVLVYCGMNALPLYGVVSALIICCHLALATPAASVYSQMLFGMPDVIDSRQMTKYTFLILIPVTIVSALIAYPLIMVFF